MKLRMAVEMRAVRLAPWAGFSSIYAGAQSMINSSGVLILKSEVWTIFPVSRSGEKDLIDPVLPQSS